MNPEKNKSRNAEEIIRSAAAVAEKKNDKRKHNNSDPSAEFIAAICQLYGDSYDDREEDSSIGGEDWAPGKRANHQSLASFQEELKEGYGLKMSTAKIRKILITGGCWTTARSREVAELYEEHGSVKKVAEELGVTEALVIMYLPYGKTVYDLDEKSGGAKRVERWRERKREKTGAKRSHPGL